MVKIDLEGLSEHISDTGDFISLDNDKCNNCGRCLIICVVNLWKKRDGKIYIAENYKEKCLECAGCYQVCEAGAISFRYPAGGTGVIYKNG
ncbi:MAG: 4Fe-4S dicluster domain-containing protein [Promethearchaeota archaeon]